MEDKWERDWLFFLCTVMTMYISYKIKTFPEMWFNEEDVCIIAVWLK